MPQNSQNLVITNKDRKDISIDCKFESKPWLDFEFEPLVLKDRETIKVCPFITSHIVGIIEQFKCPDRMNYM